MKHHLAAALALGFFVAPLGAQAAERTVTLAVQNMSCVTCPITVRKSLEAVPGIKSVSVSFENKTAVVTFDDAKTNVRALTTATKNAGYPSSPKG